MGPSLLGINTKDFQMVLMLMADSQLERVWASVRNNREGYRTGLFVPVKNLGQLFSGVQSMTASVSYDFYCDIYTLWVWDRLKLLKPRGCYI